MNVIKYKNKQKEWHTATKPLKKKKKKKNSPCCVAMPSLQPLFSELASNTVPIVVCKCRK
jgi:hypothetical protein